MGTTPVFGFPYPDPSDLVANYPALGQQLAEDVEDELLLRGKILQVVRATDTTLRTTTSTSVVDVTGMSVTITPKYNTSAIIVIASGGWSTTWTTGSSQFGDLYLTTSANVNLSGADPIRVGGLDISGVSTRLLLGGFTLIGYSTPATTSAVTYKMRFASTAATTTLSIRNDEADGQVYAIEVAA